MRGVCIICHGRSNANAIKNAIRVAAEFSDGKVNQRIEEELCGSVRLETRVSARHLARQAGRPVLLATIPICVCNWRRSSCARPPCYWSADWKPADSPLTTPWTGKVTAEHALPEYPRPQLVRTKWTNLNGLWDYAIRPKAEHRPAQFEGKLLVPFAVESALSGVKRPLTPEQRLWYRRTFTATPAKGARLLLHFGAVDWRAEVFVNGKAVGHARGRLRSVHVRHHRRAEAGRRTQELVVAVWDPTDTALQPRGKQVLNPNGIWYTAVSGIWQTVWLEPVPAALHSRRSR